MAKGNKTWQLMASIVHTRAAAPTYTSLTCKEVPLVISELNVKCIFLQAAEYFTIPQMTTPLVEVQLVGETCSSDDVSGLTHLLDTSADSDCVH